MPDARDTDVDNNKYLYDTDKTLLQWHTFNMNKEDKISNKKENEVGEETFDGKVFCMSNNKNQTNRVIVGRGCGG